MDKARIIRLSSAAALLLGSIFWYVRTSRKPDEVTLLVTFVICVVTAVYSLLTFEILLENQSMARATRESAALMEKSLRFPSSAHLSFRTVGTKNPHVDQFLQGVSPYQNADFSRAIEISEGGNSEADFVFAVVENKGPGAATKLKINAQYAIVDSGSENKNLNVQKTAALPILGVGAGIAICVFISKLPTAGDGATLISATIENSDFYRDAISEPVLSEAISKTDHQTELLVGSKLKIA
jgi:hypothetical protein